MGSPSGIDKVDLAYARFFVGHCDYAVHYGLVRPRVHRSERLAELVSEATASRWTKSVSDGGFESVAARLLGKPPQATPGVPGKGRAPNDRLQRRLSLLRWRVSPGREVLPQGSIYLNVAQLVFEYPNFFWWLRKRPDVIPVLLVHDLLPMDYPEYFLDGYQARFEKRLATITSYARAIITTSNYVAERIAREFRQRGLPPIRIHVEPLPSTLPMVETHTLSEPSLAKNPYFVVLGTIEPRKNHMLLLNIWRRLAQEHAAPPKLVIIGKRGWENEQVIDVLDRSALVKPHVIETSSLSDDAVLRLIANARALLMPSFAEGYGLPVVEALSLGTPVIASDIPVFREVSQRCALLHHPLDGIGWRNAILSLCDRRSSLSVTARAQAELFRPPNWSNYFDRVKAFLAEL